MQSIITKVMIITADNKRVSICPDKIVADIEKYRREIKEQFNARMVLFNIEEVE